MAEATSSIAQSPTIRITTAAHVLAMLHARNAVKAELRKFGLKPSHYSAREISSWTEVFFDDHCADLMPPAIEQAQRWMLEGFFGKRAQKAFIKELGIEQSQGEESVANGQS